MNNKIRRFIMLQSICLALAASSASGALAADFKDTENHWASQAIDIWSDNSVIMGHDGEFRPDDTVTRGELAVILDRIMGYNDIAENEFSDLGDSWYTDAVLKLVASGILLGDNGEIRPEDSVTREEAAVIFARAFECETSEKSALEFEDSEDISEWAKTAVASLAERGFINGFEDNTFRPKKSMSRAEFVTLINNAIKGFYTEAGTYTSDEKISGIVVVNTGDVILENMDIDGDLILAPGVGDGVVTLKDTTVSGEIITQGGSVLEEGDTIIGGDEEEETPESTPAPTNKPGGSGGGGSSITTASENNIIVNSSYENKSGTVTVDRKRYTIGKNAFSSLKEAVEKADSLEKETQITLKSNLSSDETISVKGSGITIDGGKYTIEFAAGIKDGIQAVNAKDLTIKSLNIKMNDEEGKWNGSYGIQVYGANVKLSDISVSGADAAVLVNGAEVELGGKIDVSGNEFGGIEVSKGAGVETMPKLSGKADSLKNDSESASNPTIWIDKVSELTDSVVDVEGMESIDVVEKDQKHYFVNGIPENMIAEAATAEELTDAISDPDVKIITVTGEIAVDDVLSIDRSVTIKGNSDARSEKAGITFDNTDGVEIVNAGNVTLEDLEVKVINNQIGWQGVYGVQAYGASNVTLKSVSVTGADGGILVNGAQTKLDGIVDVSGNEFGGIEVSKGVGVETMPKLTGTSENLKNDNESADNPTVWIDKVSELTAAVVDVTGLSSVEKSEKDQMHFFLNSENDGTSVTVTDEEGLKATLENGDIKIINVSGIIEPSDKIKVSRAVSIIGDESASIVFDNTDGLEIENAGEVMIENISVTVENNDIGWQGIYGIQAYGASNVTLKNVSVTGADGGILVNGAQTKLDGIVDVSGNEFGGIEVSKGVGVETMPKLTGTSENLKNDDESLKNATVWIDKVSELTAAVVEVTGLNSAESGEKDQMYFFIGEAPV